MENLYTAVLILLPMFIGFCFKLSSSFLRIIDRLLFVLVYVILLLIGIGLAQVDNLGRELGSIAFYAVLLFALIGVCNLVSMMWFDHLVPWQLNHASRAQQAVSFLDGLKQLGVVLLGVGVGLVLPKSLLPPTDTGHYALMLLIFLVGLQLRGGGIPLHQILLNKRGIALSVVFMISCAVGGILFSFFIPQVTITQGLALSSGYGWYSLSGILMTQSYGASWGSVALLNDLMRELFALACIPLLMRRFPNSAVGFGGAISMDFALPVIQHSGGLATIPVAVSFGFVLNLAAPLMMVFFTSFA